MAAEEKAAEPENIAAVLKPFVERHVLAGAVTLVATKDKVLSLDAVGYEDIATNKPMRTDALFWIASQSKPVTATALMMLVDEGKVNVDDPVEKYLPEFKDQMLATGDPKNPTLQKPAHPILVREILSHMSGLPFASPQERPTLDLLPLKEAVQSYAKVALQSEPGTKYQYANAGLNTVGRIIEVVSGMPYEEFLQKRLFDPLGMKDTTFWPNDEQLTRLAKSYKPNAAKDNLEEIPIGQLKYPLNDHAKRFPMPAGGLFSTAHDMGRFLQMVLNGGELDGKRYVSEAAVKQMTSKQTPATLKDSYGFGWGVGGGGYGHGGAYATDVNVDTKKGLIFIYFVQHAGFPGDGGKAQGAFKGAAYRLYGK
jgi:CubicO group peptidase (beta-lactamase class C family)